MGRNKLEVLISTMNSRWEELLPKIALKTDAVIINQCKEEAYTEFEYNNHRIVWVDSMTRGLSVSRNLALKYATSEFVVLADDDLEYIDGYEECILSAFKKNCEADIIGFQVKGVEKSFKNYSNKSGTVSFLKSMRMSSVELAMRRKAIIENGIWFNEKFGSGAEYKMGEENIFLFECLKCGLKIYYEAEMIAYLHMNSSTWFKGYNDKYFWDRGATYYEMFGKWAPVMILQFLVRKKRMFSTEIKFLAALKHTFLGMQYHKNEKNKE